VNPLADVDDEFARYFRSLGYVVTWDFNRTERWYEILDGKRMLCQVDIGVPIAHFLEDMALFAQGIRKGTSASIYTANGEPEDFKAIYERTLRTPPPALDT